MKKVISIDGAPAPVGPYSQAILKNDTLYGSGQIAINPFSGAFVMETIEVETEQVMKNIGALLEAADMDYSNLVKCSIFLSDMDNFERVNKVYAGFFSDLPPARETVQVARLPKDVNVEISFTAVK